MAVHRIEILGVPVDICPREELESEILKILEKPGTKQIIFLNIWGLLKARHKNDFSECINFKLITTFFSLYFFCAS